MPKMANSLVGYIDIYIYNIYILRQLASFARLGRGSLLRSLDTLFSFFFTWITWRELEVHFHLQLAFKYVYSCYFPPTLYHAYFETQIFMSAFTYFLWKCIFLNFQRYIYIFQRIYVFIHKKKLMSHQNIFNATSLNKLKSLFGKHISNTFFVSGHTIPWAYGKIMNIWMDIFHAYCETQYSPFKYTFLFSK